MEQFLYSLSVYWDVAYAWLGTRESDSVQVRPKVDGFSLKLTDLCSKVDGFVPRAQHFDLRKARQFDELFSS